MTPSSIGISMFPNDATTSEELIKYADTAMYRAKIWAATVSSSSHPI